jgi:hypothetical protein
MYIKKRTFNIRSLYCGLALVLTFSLAIQNATAQICCSSPALKPGKGFFIIPHEPGKSFHEARQNFLAEEAKLAAEDIRKGAAFLRLEATREIQEENRALLASAEELEKLAQKVENGTVDSTKDLDEAFARAHEALAGSYISKASQAWAKKDTAQAGQYLKAAIFHLNNALAWSGRTLEASSRAAIKKARRVAENLIAGVEQDADEVHQALDAVKKERKKLNEALSGKRQ